LFGLRNGSPSESRKKRKAVEVMGGDEEEKEGEGGERGSEEREE
jgi:hypothetical protein